MKIAIHNGGSWTVEVINYCINNNYQYAIVDAYSNDIVNQLKDYDIFFWHFHHSKAEDILMARNVLFSAEEMGLIVFPNFKTSWHFDDKVAQKSLLESVEIEFVNTWTFYSLPNALNWVNNEAKYPLVSKLRRGAGSYNVRLVKNIREARRICRHMFSRKGVSPMPAYLNDIKNKLIVAQKSKSVRNRLKRIPHYFKVVALGKHLFPREKGYVYFQEFIKNNLFDIRISVVGNRAWGFRRKVRSGDFRASGSGCIEYEIENIPISLIEVSMNVSKRLGFQSMAYDYVYDFEERKYKLVEISYGFSSDAIVNCPGYWDETFTFHENKTRPEVCVISDLIAALGKRDE